MTEPPSYDTGSSPGTPPGFGPPGQVPTLHGKPLAAPGVPGRRGLFIAMAFFGVLLVVAVGGLVFTRGGEIRDRAATIRDGGLVATVTPFQPRLPGTRPGAPVTAKPLGPVPKPVRYTGTGDKTIKIRRPEAGETLVYLKGNAGGGSFLVFALDGGGKQIGLLASAQEPYEGVRLLETTSFLKAASIQVQARGAWTVELRSARSAKAFTGSASGRGDTVLRYEGPAGTARIRGGGGGFGPFLVMTHKDGFPRLVATGVGEADVSKPWPAGPVLVEVQAPGAWSIRVS